MESPGVRCLIWQRNSSEVFPDSLLRNDSEAKWDDTVTVPFALYVLSHSVGSSTPIVKRMTDVDWFWSFIFARPGLCSNMI